jgi:hypothetical protein
VHQVGSQLSPPPIAVPAELVDQLRRANRKLN